MEANIWDLMNLHFDKKYWDYQIRWAYFALFCRRMRKVIKKELSKKEQKNSWILDIISELRNDVETYCLIDWIEIPLAWKIKSFNQIFDGLEKLEQNQKADYIIQQLVITLDELKEVNPIVKNINKTNSKVHKTIS